MKKYIFIIIVFVIIVGLFIYYYFFKNNNNNSNELENNTNNSYIAQKTSTADNNNNMSDANSTSDITMQTELSSFSTKIYKDTQSRYSNIKLGCQTLNNTIVKSGDTFSFWDILGCPTKETGYKKAKTFTSDGKITQSYGGGLCQISTTLYNAVLEVKELDIIERHEHSRNVNYIKDGKDAAVSYNSSDLKFKNNLDYDIKIESIVEDNKVKIRLIRI